ncbi:hypothetical protein NSA56_18335 [Oceanobacillus caeni]|uniref:Uncharacterized protein n=2 Tax=Oceanobacillus TaxID=182709 RepID=A0ABR5MFG7_9BACI|nr:MULTISPECIES: hypothetical protein [Bacillaceae]PZD83249.1 hypothetical protein DEJ60_17515 [Bacilli bacterium]KPH70544.1 hypothetical protein AFL42_16665 [Oceanobacillus caeni]MCR1836272.1 hypothetical protein [Oceanobacillus caeni]MED4475371.1 hypothetical protein [Oceanobacillus caeni]PZD84787.1 hypothetical protein DEJ66_17505 [Bacilli bacterium]
MEDVIYVATEEISDNQDIFAKGEEQFDKFINKIISELASRKIELLIGKLNDIDGISIDYKV